MTPWFWFGLFKGLPVSESEVREFLDGRTAMLRTAACFRSVVLIAGLSAFAQTSTQTVVSVVSDASGMLLHTQTSPLIATGTNHQEAAKMNTSTDESGHYSFSNVPAGRLSGITLEVTKDRKQFQSQTFTIKSHREGLSGIDITVVNPSNK
jgi:hypothetical protein